jgi:hypothetical protein
MGGCVSANESAEDQKLMEAAKYGDVNVARAALDAGANMECTDDQVRPAAGSARDACATQHRQPRTRAHRSTHKAHMLCFMYVILRRVAQRLYAGLLTRAAWASSNCC